MKYDYVIIGNSAAAAGAVSGIREKDKKGSLLIISDENHHIYSRPLISYLLKGAVSEENMSYRPETFYADNKADTMLGKKAVSVDGKKKTVKLESGEEIGYKKLLLATGSKPFVPPVKGLEKVKNMFTFMKYDDVLAIREKLTDGMKVLIVGAGLIGLKAAEALEHYNAKMTVVDLSNRILQSILDEITAAVVQKHIEQKGVRFILGTSAAEFSENSAVLANGEKVDFDMLIMAVGVRPETALCESAGGEINRGIVTDKKQAVKGVKDIYAAGDCTVSTDITDGKEKIIAILPNAYQQGVVAGKNMAGGSETSENLFPMNAIGFFGLHIITAGSYAGTVYETADGENVKKLFYSDNKLNGFILTGDKIARAGIYTALIRERTPLDSIDFELIAENPALAAFSGERRREILQ